MGKWTAQSDVDYYEDNNSVERERCATPECDGWVTFPANEDRCSDCIVRLRTAVESPDRSMEARRHG